MKKWLAIVLAIFIFALGFASGYMTCNLTHSEDHSHIPAGEWITDGENHWRTCSCGEVMESSSHVGGEATYDSKAICEVCGVEYGEVLEEPQDDPQPHTHQAKDEWRTDGENHWKACECGQEMDKAAHVGGTATTETKAICEVCGVEYGELAEAEEPVHTHKAEGRWKSDGKNHWKTCSCGEIMSKSAHNGGTATTEKKAECSVCGAEYGDYAKEEEPVHTHYYEGEWITDGESHWKICSCGELSEKSAHNGGTATTDKKAECDTCGTEYGDFAAPEEPEHVHAASGEWYIDGNNHWKVCSCGEIMSKSAHSGGTATTENKAVCSTCGEKYGELAEPEEPVHTHTADGNWKYDSDNHWKICSCGEVTSKSSHTGGTATTDKKAVCSVCGNEYGEFAESSGSSDGWVPDPDEGAEDEF